MKTTALIFAAVLVGATLFAADGDAPKKERPLPAGTRQYQVALFKRGPKWGTDPAVAKELQTERVQYLAKLEREGKISLAGTFTDRGLYHSMIVFRAESLEDAKALIAEMPSIKAERLVFEIHPWLSLDGIRVIQPRPGNPGPQPKAAPKKNEPKKSETKSEPKTPPPADSK